MRVYDERTAALNLWRVANPRPRSHLKALLTVTGIVLVIALAAIVIGLR